MLLKNKVAYYKACFSICQLTVAIYIKTVSTIENNAFNVATIKE